MKSLGPWFGVWVVLAGLLSVPAGADQIRVEWPADATGNYFLPGLGIMDQPDNKARTFEVPDGKSVRLVGTGFDISFVLEDGKIRFRQRLQEDTVGVRLDAKSHTFRFITVPVTVQVKNCDADIFLSGAPHEVPDETTHGWTKTYKLVYGDHQLRLGGSRLQFKLDAHGSVIFQEEFGGVRAAGSTIFVEGHPVEIRPADAAAKWSIPRTPIRQKVGNGTAYLLAGSYVFQSKSAANFQVNAGGYVAPAGSDSFLEFVNFPGSVLVSIPNGEALQRARLAEEKKDKEVRDRVWAETAKAAWKIDLDLPEKMDILDFPEEQLNYPVRIPAGTDIAKLELLSFTTGAVRSIPFQIENKAAAGGETQGTLSFRCNLPRLTRRWFRLLPNHKDPAVESRAMVPVVLSGGKDAREAVLGNSLIRIRVPAGMVSFPGGKPVDQVDAPILGMGRIDGPGEMVRGKLVAPESLRVLTLQAKAVENGPVSQVYEVQYMFAGKKSYRARIELRANEPQARLAEFFTGFQPEDGAMLRLDYGEGLLNPDRRLAGSNGGYDLYSGDYDRDLDGGELNYCLGLFAPNGLGVMRTTLFYRDAGEDALMLSMDRMGEWKTAKRALWSSRKANENLRFFDKEGQKYLTGGFSGGQRFWVLGLIPRSDVTFKTLPGFREGTQGIGPEGRLFNQLGLWSLDAYKNRLTDWPEKLDAAPFDSLESIDYPRGKPWEKRSYDDYVERYLKSSTWFKNTVTHSSNFGGYSDRALPAYFAEYAMSRASWTLEQRERVRLILLTLADYADGDLNQPHHSMLSGHPNFVMDTKQAVPFAIATFSTHPRAKVWRDSYVSFYNEWLERYARADNPELNTRGGRWTENIACYVGQCFAGLLPDQILLKWYDGTSLGQNPRLQLLMRWMRDAFMSPHDGLRMVPPQGAHSYAFDPDRRFRPIFFRLGEEIAPDAPELSRELKWIETNGKEGSKPDVRSGLYTDYGAVLRSDFGGQHESYAHMQNLTGLNYRWTAAGVLYYGAKGKVWSYNNSETNGDEFDWNVLSAFNVRGKGLSAGPTDQLLYDFGFAQFYRQSSAEEGNPYRARGIMLVGDNYLVVSDEVSNPKAEGTFNWVNLYDLPQIYQLKPGAPKVEKIGRDPQPPRPDNPNRIGHVLSYTGQGDFLTVVAPSAVEAASKPFGATVNGEYVFASQTPLDVKEGAVTFSGTYGYARPNQLALFQGTAIGLNGFGLHREGGDFGASAEVVGRTIIGKLVGREGGQLVITPPAGFNLAGAKARIEGKDVAVVAVGGTVSIPVKIIQADGIQNYVISFG